MEGNSGRYSFRIFLVILFLLAPVLSQAQKSACVKCHGFVGGSLAVPVAEWSGSVHQQSGITCSLCHGGDAGVALGDLKTLSASEFENRKSRAMSKSQGFVGRPSGKAMFDMCGRCHSPSVDRYARSIMGKAYLENKGGPSCVICHGAHRNTMPQVPEVCKQCHKDTSGFDQIDPMNVTESTVTALSGIRIKLASEKATGRGPLLMPEFPEDLDAFQIGFVAFGAVIVLFVIGYIVYRTLEKRG